MYIILELHGAPGSQAVNQSFTGQKTPNPGFYQNGQYDRAIKFVAWLRRLIHDTHEMRNVGMIGLVNENVRGNTPESLRTYYYPKAQQVGNTHQGTGRAASSSSGPVEPESYLP